MTVKEEKVPFEVALSMTGYSKYNLLMFMLCGSIITAMVFEIFSVSYLVPGSACELETTSTEQGLMASMPLAGIIATSHIWGYLADTKGRKKILFISMTMSFVAGLVATFSVNWIMLCVCKFVSSASVAGAFALSVTLLSECTPADKRTTLLLLSTSVFLSSIGTMAVLSIPVLPLTFSYYVPYLNIYFNSWRLLGLIYTLPCAFSAFGILCAYESPKYLLSVGKDQEALDVLKRIYLMNNAKGLENFKVDALVLDEDGGSSLNRGFWSSIVHQTIPMLRPPLLKYTLLLSTLFVMIYICINSFMVWMPFIVDAFVSAIGEEGDHLTICEMIRLTANTTTTHEAGGQCTMNSFAMLIVFGTSILLGVLNTTVSAIVSSIGRKKTFIGLQMICGIACVSLNFSNFWILSAILFMVLISGCINFGLLSTFSVDVFPTYVKAMAVSLTLMVGRGSAVVGINVLKQMLDTNCESAFYVFGTISIVGGLIGLLLPSDAKISEQKNVNKA